jgi:hypothetical protein
MYLQFTTQEYFKVQPSLSSHVYKNPDPKSTTGDLCLISVSSTTQKHITLGGPFTGTFYTIFDGENKRIGVAPYKSSLGDDIIHFLPVYAIVVPVAAVVLLIGLCIFSFVMHTKEAKAAQMLQEKAERSQSVYSTLDDDDERRKTVQ